MKRAAWRSVAALAAAVATVLSMPGCRSSDAVEPGDPKPLILAEVPHQQAAARHTFLQPILEMLEEETGRQINVLNASNYAAVIEGARTGKIDIAAFGPFSYIRAKQQGARMTAVAARVNQKGEQPGYRSYGITRSELPIKSLADFRGKKVCLVDEDSTSGYLYPKAELLSVGIELERDTTPVFVGAHDASVLAVASGQCDAGFAADLELQLQTLQIPPGQIAPVWTSEIIPGGPIAISDDLPPALRQKLTEALLTKADADYLRNNGFCRDECAAADGYAYGYSPVDDTFYDSVREVCRKLGETACARS